ncbi:MAG: peptide ABC transporter substrate-binding protein [Actinomycetota bacterium]
MPAGRWVHAALVASLLLVGACTQDPDPTPQRGGSIRVEGHEPASLDPAQANDPAETRIVRNLFRGLVQFDEHRGAVQPASATNWEISSDARTFVFTLRDDGLFSNGEAVRAENFVRAFDRATAPSGSSPLAAYFSNIAGYAGRRAGSAPTLSGVDALDEFTLRITLTEPDAEFLSKLTHPVFSPVPSDSTMRSRKPSWGEAPIGNGPWQLKEPWKHNESIVLQPNPRYTGSDKPHLDEAVFVLLDDVGVSYDQWLAGNLDWTQIPDERLERVRAENPGQIITKVMPRLAFLIAFPATAPTFRQALSLAMDRAVLARTAVLGGLAIPATGIVPPGIPGYREPGPDVLAPCEPCRYDAAQAKRLVAESGARLTKPLTISFTPIRDQARWSSVVAAGLERELGIDTETSSVRPLSDYLDALRRGRLQGLAAFEVSMATPSIDELLAPLFHSSAVGTTNLARYQRRDVDGLIDAARAEPDDSERLELYREAEDRILQDLPIIPLWWMSEIRLARLSKFGGLGMDQFGDPTITTAFLKPGN